MRKKHTCFLKFGFVWGALPSSSKIRPFTTSKDGRETCRDGVGLPPVLVEVVWCIPWKIIVATHTLVRGSCDT
jgi:hypothetical protein